MSREQIPLAHTAKPAAKSIRTALASQKHRAILGVNKLPHFVGGVKHAHTVFSG
jgi:hypothetical protein